jgi:hypothetical protein
MVPRPRQHVFCRFASDQKSAVAGKFPGLEEQLLGGVEQWLVDVGSGVVEAYLDGTDFLLDLFEHGLYVGFLARIDTDGMDFVSFCLHFIDEILGLCRFAACNTDLIPAPRKSPCDRCADGVTCANQQNHAISLSHSFLHIGSYLALY